MKDALRNSTTAWLASGLLAAAGVTWAPGVLHAGTGDPGLAEPNRTRMLDPAVPVDDFALADQEGRAARFSELRGNTVLVFFGFTNCQSVCPAAMQKLRHVRRLLESVESPPIALLVSIDGERDSPEAMKAFLAPFGAGFVGFTGPPAVVRPIAGRFSAVFFKGGQTDTAGGYDVEHTSQVYLVDQEGRMRATFYNASADDMAAVIRRVMPD
jgi:protein SCO1/2